MSDQPTTLLDIADRKDGRIKIERDGDDLIVTTWRGEFRYTAAFWNNQAVEIRYNDLSDLVLVTISDDNGAELTVTCANWQLGGHFDYHWQRAKTIYQHSSDPKSEIPEMVEFLQDEDYTETNADVDYGKSRTYRVDSDSVLVFYRNPVFTQAQCESFESLDALYKFFYGDE